MKTNILEREELWAAQRLYALACLYSRLHSLYAGQALERYGDHGPQISGCVRDHFPEHVKSELRGLAGLISDKLRIADEIRPPRVRESTMRHLARTVATRDGTGFYGPQPYRSTR